MATEYFSAIWSIAFGRKTADGKRVSDMVVASQRTVAGIIDTLNVCGSVDLSLRKNSDGTITLSLTNERNAGALGFGS